MENQIQIFSNPEFGSVRTVMIDGEPWFVGKDAATALGYADTSDALKRHVDDEDKLTRRFTDSGQSRQMYVINESGLYSLVMSSKLKNSRKFQRWVTSEVLPSIRKSGSYSVNDWSVDDKIAILSKGYLETKAELKADIQEVRTELEDFKKDLPILPMESDIITSKVKKRGTELLGGKDSAAYRDHSVRSKVYSAIHSNIKYNFNVTSYKQIRRNQCDQVLEVIDNFVLPIYLAELVADTNAQLAFA